jgi:hypothetical protein
MQTPSLMWTPSLTHADTLSRGRFLSHHLPRILPHSSELPIPPPEGSDEGEPMSLSNLLAPNDVVMFTPTPSIPPRLTRPPVYIIATDLNSAARPCFA